MNFKIWLEQRRYPISMSWAGVWRQKEIGDRPIIQADIFPSYVDVEPSPFHPMMKRAMRTLVRQFPEILNIQIKFDGWSPGTVNDYLRNPDVHGPKDKLPRYIYTGTSMDRWEIIKEEGLKPRNETGTQAVYGAGSASAPPGNPDHVYFAATPNATVRFAALSASRDGSLPVILRINSSGLNPNQLHPDVDINVSHWSKSMQGMNTFAYEGIVDPQYIELFKVRNEDTKVWEDPTLPPLDWLARTTLDKTGYKNIPGTTASYKWANPKGKT